MPAPPFLKLHESASLVPAMGPDGTARALESRLASAMANYLLETAPDTGAEALKLLRRMYPDTPLADRVAALAATMRR
jgi:hypothetical protein